MRILFLDFDGVLHPISVLRWFEMRLPLETIIQRARLFRWTWILAELLEPYPDVRIIVHSSWRLLKTDAELSTFLGPLSNRFTGSTPHVQRWESIEWVLQQNRLSDFRILDDHPEEFPLQLDELIVCDSELGVYDEAVRNQLMKWLAINVE
ncbi:MAG: hypothetical protein JWQ21_2928 [Herminiimonas sp.]|nr:hypothetical protein [Herminiimonas sp.]